MIGTSCKLVGTCIVFFALVIQAADAEEFAYPSTLSLEQVQEWVDRCQVDHPRLLTSGDQLAGLRSAVAADPVARATAEGIIRQAEAMLPLEPIERKLQGRRLLGKSRICIKRVLSLAMAYHLTGEAKFARRAEKEMLAAAEFRDWNPSHFLDVAEMTFALAIGYDWLYDELGEASRATIRKAIVEQGVSLPFNSSHNRWVRSQNNWGQVCHGGMTAGALAVMEDEPELAARTVHSALHNVCPSMEAYAPNGSYPEGPVYWSYGTSFNVILVGVLESTFGTDFGLTRAPGFEQTGQYPAIACGPSGLFFNYADGSAGRATDPSLFWFANRFSRPDWLLGERERLEKTAAALSQESAAGGGDRLLPLVLLWMGSTEPTDEIRMPLHWHGQGRVPVTIHRSDWADPNATYVGFKGGSPSANHGQMDIGSFVLDADGVRWGMDLGAEGYHGIESRGMDLWNRKQDSDRWTIFRQCNAGHNTLVIDGQLQQANGEGHFVKFSGDPTFPHSILDMSSVYQGQAESVQRGIALLSSGEVLIQDQLAGLKPGATVRWGMITPATCSGAGSSSMELVQQDAKLALHLLPPNAASWSETDTSEPRNPWDSPNQGTRLVNFEAIAPESGALTFAVLATPGSCRQSEKEHLRLERLADWGRGNRGKGTDR